MPLAVLANVKTKIVATIGPASESLATLEQLARAGADVFRLNFAHGTWDWHSTVVDRIHAVSRQLDRPLAILQDLGGPKLRLGELPGGNLICNLGDRLRFVRAPTGNPKDLTCTYDRLVDDLREGDSVLLADGTVALRVLGKTADAVGTEVVLAGEIRSRQGINLPGVRLGLSSLTPKDLEDLDWTARHPIDYVGLSFVRQAEDIDQLRQELDRRGCHAQIVAKIEKPEALENLEAIISRTDAVMVARGDLGVEVDVARVPVLQKQIIQHCNRAGIPVITATQMLESMRTSNRPTRAEASDVANAILDGTDAVMLSAETASGQYPVAAVETMNRIALETEKALPRQFTQPQDRGQPTSTTKAMVEAASYLADRVHSRLVVVATEGGHTALALSKQRNFTPTLGLSDELPTVRRMCLYWGVLPVLFEETRQPAEFVNRVTRWAVDRKIVEIGERIVFVFGLHWAESGDNAVLVQEVQ